MVSAGTLSEIELLININEGGRTVLKISTSSCGPCRTLQKTIEDLENEGLEKYGIKDENVTFIGVDADELEDDEILDEYNVRGVPVLIVMDEKGDILSQTVGLQTKDQIIERLR